MRARIGAALVLSVIAPACGDALDPPGGEYRRWEAANPLRSVPKAPLGTGIVLTDLPDPPTPQRVRLGRWLFFDTRLSRDGSLSCASCHQPEHAFSQTTAVATGIGSAKGARKVPTIINLAVLRAVNFSARPRAFFFWDGRAATLEQQALEPIANPIEMANSHEQMVDTISNVPGYRRYFAQAFGDPHVTKARVARAIADYERTRMSGNSPFDRWQFGKDNGAVSDEVKQGFTLFSEKGRCVACHPPPLFTDGGFHNLGIGWDAIAGRFADEGRHAATKGTVLEADPGTFKTPTLREVTKHAPYMHDGSIATLREVVEFYNRGGIPNADLDNRIPRAGMQLTPEEIDAIVAFLGALEGEGWQDAGPSHFPR